MLFLSFFLLCFHARLFVDALWSPVRKGLTCWLSFVMSDCDVVTFPLVSWVRCGALLYRSLIFALFFLLLFIYLPFCDDVSSEKITNTLKNTRLTKSFYYAFKIMIVDL